MANLAPPSSQKAGERPISFLLDGQLGGSTFLDLVIRPEDLVRVDPSRASVQQTLGGAWADNFGPGLAQITINGHTGWRRTAGDSDDGLERFKKLKTNVFDEWHLRRAESIKSGMDPNDIRLIFSDALDGFSVVAAPMSFTLRRSKQSPLLARYQIALIVLDDTGLVSSSIFGSGSRDGLVDADMLEAAGLDSLTASVDRITSSVNSIKKLVDAKLVAPIASFMNQTARLYGSVRGLISAGAGVVGSVISAAQMTARAGVNLFRTLAAVASIPQQAKAALMSVAGAYSNILCVMRNALRQQIYFQDYSDLFGSSNCSSTAGGRPISSIAGENPFYKVVPTAGPSPVSISQPAQGALMSIASSDVALEPMSTPSLVSAMRTVADGMVVA